MIRFVCIWIALLQYCLAFFPSSFRLSGRSQRTNGHTHFVLVTSNPIRSLSVLEGKQCRGTIFSASKDDDHNNHEYLKEDIIETTNMHAKGGGVGEFSKAEKLGLQRETANVGDPQLAQLETMNITKVLTELQAIQSQGPKKYCILGTRHCSFLHQQIVEML